MMEILATDRKIIVGIMSLIYIIFALSGICEANNKNPAIFIFGDSLVDAGNNDYFFTLARVNRLPNGIDFGSPTGRFTNGRMVMDIIGQELGLKDFIPPYLAPTTVGAVVLQGVNYASGASGIVNHTGHMFIGRINLDAQIDNFANTRKDIISSVGAPAAQNLLNKALFTIIIGSNDFINNYFTPFISIGKRMLVPPETFVGILISKFRLQLTRLYKLDARKFLVTNVGPIGCIPYMRDTNPSSRGNCTEKVNKVAKLYNAQLKSLIIELTANLGGSKFVYADSYYIVKDIIQNYASYGFENANSSCCHLAGRHGGLLPCVPLSKVCPDRSKYFFWDAYHPSDAANVIISKRLMDGNDSRDIWPMNIRQLVDS